MRYHTVSFFIIVVTDYLRPFSIIVNRQYFVWYHLLIIIRIGLVCVARLQRKVEHQMLLLPFIVEAIDLTVFLSEKPSIIDNIQIILTSIHLHVSLSCLLHFFIRQPVTNMMIFSIEIRTNHVPLLTSLYKGKVVGTIGIIILSHYHRLSFRQFHLSFVPPTIKIEIVRLHVMYCERYVERT